MHNFKLISLLILSVIILVSLGCGKERTHAETNREIIRNVSQIQTDTVRVEALNSMLEVTGVISFNEENVLKIYPVAAGRVEKVNAELGDYVRRGDILAVVKSRDIASLKNDMNAAEANLAVAQKNLSATEEMFKSGIISERDYLAAQNEVKKIVSEIEKIKSTMTIYSGHNSSEYLVKAPMSGYIVEKSIVEGMMLREDISEPVFTITDFNNLWIMVNIFEKDIHRVKVGDVAKISTIAYPNQIIEGKIDKIFNIIDPESRTMRARILVENKDLKLKPGMFAFITIGSSQMTEHLTVAPGAIVFKESKNFVIIINESGEQELRKVKVGDIIGNRQIIESGLKIGEVCLLTDNLFAANRIIEQSY